MPQLTANILAALPQTQCTRCGYPDCAAYAQAVASGKADINQCPPGGAEGVARLAALTGLVAQPLNPGNGVEGPRSVAFIDEAWCIGCTLCITACPVDAIIGTNKRMHTVIESYCTGCELCLPACPVDCILMENASGSTTGWAAWSAEQAVQARKRYEFNSFRRLRDELERHEGVGKKAALKPAGLAAQSTHTAPATVDKKRLVIEAALARARAKRAAN